jgi:diaminopimelate epimerase
MLIQFTKMHGLGNDFVVIEALTQTVNLTSAQVRHIADRRFGVGCDQVLVVEAARSANVDFFYRIYNADGEEVEQCGNGARCLALFVREAGFTSKNELAVETRCGIIHLHVDANGQVRVNMGVPRNHPADVPFVADKEALTYTVQAGGQAVELSVVSMGNPHAVMRVPNIAHAPVHSLGPVLEKHDRFPARVNVGFMEVVDHTHIRLRVYERGAGETLACGTGACAAVVAGCRLDVLDNKVTVDVTGGRLLIQWAGQGQPVWMTGPATRVYKGQIEL